MEKCHWAFGDHGNPHEWGLGPDSSRVEILKIAESWFPAGRRYFAANLFWKLTRTHRSFEWLRKSPAWMWLSSMLELARWEQRWDPLWHDLNHVSPWIVDICVVRHSEVDYYKQLIDNRTIQTSVSMVRWWFGATPSHLLDLLCIYEEFGTFENLKICIAGITHSRPSYTNSQTFGCSAFICWSCRVVLEWVRVYSQHVAIIGIIEDLDVLMLLRVQHERRGR